MALLFENSSLYKRRFERKAEVNAIPSGKFGAQRIVMFSRSSQGGEVCYVAISRHSLTIQLAEIISSSYGDKFVLRNR